MERPGENTALLSRQDDVEQQGGDGWAMRAESVDRRQKLATLGEASSKTSSHEGPWSYEDQDTVWLHRIAALVILVIGAALVISSYLPSLDFTGPFKQKP